MINTRIRNAGHTDSKPENVSVPHFLTTGTVDSLPMLEARPDRRDEDARFLRSEETALFLSSTQNIPVAFNQESITVYAFALGRGTNSRTVKQPAKQPQSRETARVLQKETQGRKSKQLEDEETES